MDNNSSLLCLPKELIQCIIQDFNSPDMQNFMKTCKLYSVTLKIVLKLLLKQELKNSVFRAKPFTPSDISHHDEKIEIQLYGFRYVYEIILSNKVIGYVKYNGEFWCGYYIVPITWFDEDRPALDLPEITFTDMQTSTIGWDHDHIRDLIRYTNLSMVIAEFWSVWAQINQGSPNV